MDVMTLQEKIYRRSGHVAVSYGDSMLVWGGFMESLPAAENDSQNNANTQETCVYHSADEIWMYHHDTEIWKRLLTTGDIPPRTCGSCGVVLGDSLYVFGGITNNDYLFGNSNQLYRLDLIKRRWHLLSPEGQAPTPCDKLAGWAHGDKVYFFGGFGPVPTFNISFKFVSDPSTVYSSMSRGWNNQLVAYDPSTNAWLWPKVSGEPPSPRAAHAADITGDKVYIFGGRFMVMRRNDLFCLDLSAMQWSPVYITSSGNANNVPAGRSWHSFTFLTPSRAIVYGGLNNENMILNDCWNIDVEQKLVTRTTTRFVRPVKIETVKLNRLPPGRFWHQVVVSPDRERLCVVGGTVARHNQITNARDHAEELLVLEFTPKSLFRLSMDVVLKNIPVNQWFEKHCLPQEVESILLLRLEQNPCLPEL